MTSINDMIKLYGETEPLKVFGGVKTYKDLLEANIGFLEGKVTETPYHGGPVDDETLPLLKNLIELHKNGIYTIEGQPALCEYGTYVDKEWIVRGKKQGNWFTDTEQMSYMIGFIPKTSLDDLAKYLDEANVYYVIHDTKTGEVLKSNHVIRINNSTVDLGMSLVVTQERAHKSRQKLKFKEWEPHTDINIVDEEDDILYHYTDLHDIDLENIKNILLNCVKFQIAIPEFCEGSVEDLMLKFVKQTKIQIGGVSKKRSVKRVSKKRSSKKRSSKKKSSKRVSKKRSSKKRSSKRVSKKRSSKKRSSKKRSSKKRSSKRVSKKRSSKKRSVKRVSKKRSSKKRSVKRVSKKRSVKRVSKKRSSKKRSKKRSSKKRSVKRVSKKRSKKR